MSLDDLARGATALRARVATLDIHLKSVDEFPLLPEQRTGYGVPIGPRRVALLAHLLEHAASVRVRGPDGEAPAQVELDDRERRVAVVVAERPLAELGLRIPPAVPAQDRKRDLVVFALIETSEQATAVSGQLEDPGTEERLEHLPVVSIDLQLGMPVFDGQLRWVGLSRTLGWDRQPGLLIPPEKVEAARLEAAQRASKSKAPHPPERPWWARPRRRPPGAVPVPDWARDPASPSPRTPPDTP